MHAESRGRIGALDGLRATAILLVMLFHFTRGHGGAPLWRMADIGWAGVDLFFVLSGFLITGILLRTKGSPDYLRNFYSRRALRILPVYYLTLLVAFVAVPLIVRACPAPPFLAQAPFWFYYANFSLGPASPCYILGHLWSLAIEEQFYLLWPIVILRTSDAAARRICLAMILIAFTSRLALALAGAPTETSFAWTFARFDGLGIGSFLALSFQSDALRRRLERLCGPVMVACGALLLLVVSSGRSGLVFEQDQTIGVIASRSGMPLLLAIFFAAMLVAGVTKPSFRGVLDRPLGAVIARYSYGGYVFHLFLMPVLVHSFPRAQLVTVTGSNNAAVALFAGIATVATLAAAALSYHGFERFFLALKPARVADGAPAAPRVAAR